MKRIILHILACAVLSSPALADLKLALKDRFPVVGADQEVRLEGEAVPPGVELKVIYRPKSQTKVEAVVGPFGEGGRILWRPAAPGLTRLIAKLPDRMQPDGKTVVGETLATKNVATCYTSPPILGIVVMVLAGILLFGGAAVSLVMALKKTPEEE